jgi:hypothetical protein
MWNTPMVICYKAQLLTQKLLKQGHVAPRLTSSPQKLYDRHHDMVDVTKIHISNDSLSFTFYVDIFFIFSITAKKLTGLIRTTKSGISYQLRDILHMQVGYVAPYINGKFTKG